MATKEAEIGALWLRKSKDGNTTYLSGVINGIPVIVFKNGFKKEDKHPDYRVYKSEPKSTPAATTDNKRKFAATDNKRKSAADKDDDIPF
jgi:uncharacterized protein (DUF736 family)